MAHQFATQLALIGFATATIQGLIEGANFGPTIKMALAALAVFYVFGFTCGELARRAVEESVSQPGAPEKTQT